MVEVENVVKRFQAEDGERIVAVDDLSFSVEQGQLFTLLGPSGCGKTTTLRCLAGFEHLDEGRISIDGTPVSDPANGRFDPPEKRQIGFVFQSYAVWPHMSVRDNILFALKNRQYPKDQWDEQIRWALDLVNLPDIQDRYPSELSGGQQQRVAVARAIAYEPSLLLMDEPLSNLDFQQRKRMRQELLDILDTVDMTTIYVTHDQAEAFEISDEVTVMNDGQKQQQGPPKELYDNPRTPFVASFIGDANVIPVELTELLEDGYALCTPKGYSQDIEFCCTYQSEDALEDPVTVFRPEHVQLKSVAAESAGAGPGGEEAIADATQGSSVGQQAQRNVFVGTVVKQLYRGGVILHDIEIGDFTITGMGSAPDIEEGDEVRAQIAPEKATIIRDTGDWGE